VRDRTGTCFRECVSAWRSRVFLLGKTGRQAGPGGGGRPVGSGQGDRSHATARTANTLAAPSPRRRSPGHPANYGRRASGSPSSAGHGIRPSTPGRRRSVPHHRRRYQEPVWPLVALGADCGLVPAFHPAGAVGRTGRGSVLAAAGPPGRLDRQSASASRARLVRRRYFRSNRLAAYRNAGAATPQSQPAVTFRSTLTPSQGGIRHARGGRWTQRTRP